MKSAQEVIVIDEKDNVGTALAPLAASDVVSVRTERRVERVRLISDIPKGHKLALTDIERGSAVIKYGEAIGEATAKIARGEHVQVHNVVSIPRGGVR